MIVLDASVMIAVLDDQDAHHLQAVDVLVHSPRPVMHTINMAEILVWGVREGDLDALVETVRGLGVVELERVRDEAARLAGLRASTKLKLPDCCALMAAESTSSPLATFDARLAEAARDRGVVVLGAAE